MGQTRFETRDDLASKIEWEGGIWELLEGGTTIEDMPDNELFYLWLEIEEKYVELSRYFRKLEKLLGFDG